MGAFFSLVRETTKNLWGLCLWTQRLPLKALEMGHGGAWHMGGAP